MQRGKLHDHISFRGSVLSGVLLVVAVAGVIAVLTWYLYCPCDRTPGGYLLGTEVTEPVDDWTFANEVPLCQLQVQTGFLAHSINLNCMSSEGELFLSCSQCDGKRWSTAALENPDARLRAHDSVYPVTVTRVIDEATLDRAWIARATKIGRPANTPRREGWWSFKVATR